jgi:hypothetical protein
MRLVVQHDGREVVKAIDMLDESIAMPTAGRVRKCASASPPRRTHTHAHTRVRARTIACAQVRTPNVYEEDALRACTDAHMHTVSEHSFTRSSRKHTHTRRSPRGSLLTLACFE